MRYVTIILDFLARFTGISLFFTLFSTVSLFSMDIRESRGVKRKMEEYPEVKRQKDDITLISSDGIEFIVPRTVAEQSQTIKYLLEDISTQEITLAHISGANLKDLLAIMRVLHERKDESKKEIMQAFEQLSLAQQPPAALEEQEMPQYLVQFDPLYEWSQLLLAANYLDLGPSALDFLGKKVVETARNPSELELAKEYIIRDLDKYIARHYYLRFGQNLSGVDPNSYGFSLQELIEHNRIDMKKLHTFMHGSFQLLSQQSINLSDLRINDLDGFSQLISDRAEIRFIDLSHNQLAHLPENLLQRFDLYIFDASYNMLKDLPPELFKGVPVVQLNLNNNRLKALPENIFDDLGGPAGYRTVINLQNNQLSQLPERLFSKAKSLYDLNLSFNHLEQLPENLFSSCPSLRFLDLSNNKFKQLPQNVFATLNTLEHLDLSCNEFKSLSARLFSGLNVIGFINLLDNPLISLPDFEIPRPKVLMYRDDLKQLAKTDNKQYENELRAIFYTEGRDKVIILLSH